jgi:hypothetical protein
MHPSHDNGERAKIVHMSLLPEQARSIVQDATGVGECGGPTVRILRGNP